MERKRKEKKRKVAAQHPSKPGSKGDFTALTSPAIAKASKQQPKAARMFEDKTTDVPAERDVSECDGIAEKTDAKPFSKYSEAASFFLKCDIRSPPTAAPKRSADDIAAPDSDADVTSKPAPLHLSETPSEEQRRRVVMREKEGLDVHSVLAQTRPVVVMERIDSEKVVCTREVSGDVDASALRIELRKRLSVKRLNSEIGTVFDAVAQPFTTTPPSTHTTPRSTTIRKTSTPSAPIVPAADHDLSPAPVCTSSPPSAAAVNVQKSTVPASPVPTVPKRPDDIENLVLTEIGRSSVREVMRERKRREEDKTEEDVHQDAGREDAVEEKSHLPMSFFSRRKVPSSACALSEKRQLLQTQITTRSGSACITKTTVDRCTHSKQQWPSFAPGVRGSAPSASGDFTRNGSAGIADRVMQSEPTHIRPGAPHPSGGGQHSVAWYRSLLQQFEPSQAGPHQQIRPASRQRLPNDSLDLFEDACPTQTELKKAKLLSEDEPSDCTRDDSAEEFGPVPKKYNSFFEDRQEEGAVADQARPGRPQKSAGRKAPTSTKQRPTGDKAKKPVCKDTAGSLSGDSDHRRSLSESSSSSSSSSSSAADTPLFAEDRPSRASSFSITGSNLSGSFGFTRGKMTEETSVLNTVDYSCLFVDDDDEFSQTKKTAMTRATSGKRVRKSARSALDSAASAATCELASELVGSFNPSEVMVLESLEGDTSSPEEHYFQSLYGMLVKNKASAGRPATGGHTITPTAPPPAECTRPPTVDTETPYPDLVRPQHPSMGSRKIPIATSHSALTQKTGSARRKPRPHANLCE